MREARPPRPCSKGSRLALSLREGLQSLALPTIPRVSHHAWWWPRGRSSPLRLRLDKEAKEGWAEHLQHRGSTARLWPHHKPDICDRKCDT